jgi:protein TonB
VASAPATPPPAAAAPRPTAASLRPISTPQPPYPREAARSRASGSVTVQFTVAADGSVTNIEVLRARPRGLFERSVEETVATWRFEAPGEPVTLTRTFDFRM